MGKKIKQILRTLNNISVNGYQQLIGYQFSFLGELFR